MALVTHTLARVVPRDARPFGAALLTAWLILPGTPRPPARSALFFCVAKKQLLTGSKTTAKTKSRHTPPARATGDFKGKFDWRGTWKTRDGNGTPMVIQRVY